MKNQSVVRRFFRKPIAVVGLTVIAVLGMWTLLGPVVLVDPDAIDYYHRFVGPLGAGHLLGTDDLGRDVLSRLAAGGRVSLSLGLGVAITGSIVGTILGAVAGYYRGRIDTVISRLIDILLAMPTIALLMVISGFIPVGPVQLLLVMSSLSWMGVARLVRGQVLSLRETEFVTAARTVGARSFRIIVRHLLPNVLAPVTVAATLAVAYTILIESALSYLGFGVQPPTATWGNMLQGAQRYMRTAPWLAILPGILIAITVTSFNYVGDALREAVDPRLRGRVR